MAQKTDAQLTTEAQVIKTETQEYANTATRIGNMFQDIIDSKTNSAEGGGIALPKPLICIDGNNLYVKFTDTTFLTEQNQAEIFLYRYNNTKSRKVPDPQNPQQKINKKKIGKWGHPSTDGANVKWAGWKFFAGEHKYHTYTFSGTYQTTITGRVTEWTIPLTVKPMELFPIGYNHQMFFSIIDPQNTSNPIYNMDGIGNVGLADYNFAGHTGLDGTVILKITQGKKAPTKVRYTKVIKLALAIAIHNPKATKQNGLCPKIIGELSEPFYAIFNIPEGQTHFRAIKLVKIEDSRDVRIRIDKTQ